MQLPGCNHTDKIILVATGTSLPSFDRMPNGNCIFGEKTNRLYCFCSVYLDTGQVTPGKKFSILGNAHDMRTKEWLFLHVGLGSKNITLEVLNCHITGSLEAVKQKKYFCTPKSLPPTLQKAVVSNNEIFFFCAWSCH